MKNILNAWKKCEAHIVDAEINAKIIKFNIFWIEIGESQVMIGVVVTGRDLSLQR